jgi:hypothetical protein
LMDACLLGLCGLLPNRRSGAPFILVHDRLG